MPGAGMPDFTRNSVTIAKAGIYDLRLHHDAVIMPVLKFWNVFDRTDLGPEGEKARQELADFLVGLDAQASRFVEQRERARARAAARAAVLQPTGRARLGAIKVGVLCRYRRPLRG